MTWSTRIASQFGSVFGLVLMAIGVVSMFRGALVGGIWWVLIGMFVRGASHSSYEELLRRQNPDGTWRNAFTDAKEDDPLVSTPWAAAALAVCRSVVAGETKTLFPNPKFPPAEPAKKPEVRK